MPLTGYMSYEEEDTCHEFCPCHSPHLHSHSPLIGGRWHPYHKAVRVGGEEKGGHVLRETTSRGLCGLAYRIVGLFCLF
jgi:hypothetical protein